MEIAGWIWFFAMVHTAQGKTKVIGILLALGAAVLYSTKAIFVKLAYQYDIDSITLLALRMLAALPFYLIVQLFYKESRHFPRVKFKYWIGAALAAFLGYYLASFLDFWGLQFVDASLERLLLFTYPTFILLIARFWLKERITRHQLGAIMLSYLGIILVFSPSLGHLTFGSQFLNGVIAILGCAVAFASYMVLSQKLIPRIGSTRYTSVAMMFACCFVLGHYIATEPITHIAQFPAPVYYYGAAMGIIATVIPSYFMNHAIQRIGASRTGIIASVGPISTIALAYLLLDERLVFIQWAGALCIILSITFISLEKTRKTD